MEEYAYSVNALIGEQTLFASDIRRHIAASLCHPILSWYTQNLAHLLTVDGNEEAGNDGNDGEVFCDVNKFLNFFLLGQPDHELRTSLMCWSELVSGAIPDIMSKLQPRNYSELDNQLRSYNTSRASCEVSSTGRMKRSRGMPATEIECPRLLKICRSYGDSCKGLLHHRYLVLFWFQFELSLGFLRELEVDTAHAGDFLSVIRACWIACIDGMQSWCAVGTSFPMAPPPIDLMIDAATLSFGLMDIQNASGDTNSVADELAAPTETSPAGELVLVAPSETGVWSLLGAASMFDIYHVVAMNGSQVSNALRNAEGSLYDTAIALVLGNIVAGDANIDLRYVRVPGHGFCTYLCAVALNAVRHGSIRSLAELENFVLVQSHVKTGLEELVTLPSITSNTIWKDDYEFALSTAKSAGAGWSMIADNSKWGFVESVTHAFNLPMINIDLFVPTRKDGGLHWAQSLITYVLMPAPNGLPLTDFVVVAYHLNGKPGHTCLAVRCPDL